MTKKHERHVKHVHCEHEEVAFCGPCDVAYCKSCKQEWGECKMQHYPYYWHFDTPTVPTQPYWAPTISDTPWVTNVSDPSNTTYTAAHAAHTN